MRLPSTVVTLVGVFFLLWLPGSLAQEQQQLLRFTVMALSDSNESRRAFENQLVNRLSEDRYDVIASYELISDLNTVRTDQIRSRLLESGIQAILILRPLEMAEGVELSAAQLQMSPGEFTSVSQFISAYRGDNFEIRTIVQIVGFLLQNDGVRLFWHGTIWLDDTVETEQNRIDKLVDLVQFNLNNSRSALRAQLGLPPLAGN